MFQYLTSGQFEFGGASLGGMHTKTIRAHSCVSQFGSCQIITSIDDVVEGEILIIEPLGLRADLSKGLISMGDLTDPSFIDRLRVKLKLPRRIILYISELEFLRWPTPIRQLLIGTANIITHTCEFQRRMLNAMGLRTSLLVDPIPDSGVKDHSSSGPIVLSGSLNIPKGMIKMIKLGSIIKALSPSTQLHVCGSINHWEGGEDRNMRALNIEFSDLMDVIVPLKSPESFLSFLKTQHVWASVTTHDVYCSTAVEVMSMGLLSCVLDHPSLADRTVYRLKDLPLLASKLIEITTRPYNDFENTALKALRSRYVNENSSEAFLTQFEHILKEINYDWNHW